MLRLLSVVLLTIALFSSIAQAEDSSALGSAAYSYLVKRGDNSHPILRTFSFDLNGDGRVDGIVLLTGNDWCGSGGCNMLVFRGTETGFSFVSQSTITQEPLMVLPETQHGWRTLIVNSGRTGKVLLQFDGHRYPSSPSIQPKPSLQQVEQAQVLEKQLVGK